MTSWCCSPSVFALLSSTYHVYRTTNWHVKYLVAKQQNNSGGCGIFNEMCSVHLKPMLGNTLHFYHHLQSISLCQCLWSWFLCADLLEECLLKSSWHTPLNNSKMNIYMHNHTNMTCNYLMFYLVVDWSGLKYVRCSLVLLTLNYLPKLKRLSAVWCFLSL